MLSPTRQADLFDTLPAQLSIAQEWAPESDCRSDHFVQFYESDECLIERLTKYILAGLAGGSGGGGGGAALAIVTPEHQTALASSLLRRGVDVNTHLRVLIVDAGEFLARVMVGGSPDPARFRALVHPMLRQLGEGGRTVHAFGETVALLWNEAKFDAAVRLEALWNEALLSHRASLCCAYPMRGFTSTEHRTPFMRICCSHTRVLPPESYTQLAPGLRARLAAHSPEPSQG